MSGLRGLPTYSQGPDMRLGRTLSLDTRHNTQKWKTVHHDLLVLFRGLRDVGAVGPQGARLLLALLPWAL